MFNPNVETEQDHFFRFSKNPTFACNPSCLPGGTIGITKTGVALYNPLTNEGLNAGNKIYHNENLSLKI